MAEVEEMFKRLMSNKGVKGLIVMNNDGVVIKTNIDNTSSVHHAGLIHQFLSKTHSDLV